MDDTAQERRAEVVQQCLGLCRDVQDVTGTTMGIEDVRSICGMSLSDDDAAEVLHALELMTTTSIRETIRTEARLSVDGDEQVATAPPSGSTANPHEEPRTARRFAEDAVDESVLEASEALVANTEQELLEPSLVADSDSVASLGATAAVTVSQSAFLSAVRSLEGVEATMTSADLHALALEGQEQLTQIPSAPSSSVEGNGAAQELLRHRDAAVAAKALNLKKLQEEQAKLDERLRVLRCEEGIASSDYEAAKGRLVLAKQKLKCADQAARLLNEIATKRAGLERKLEVLQHECAAADGGEASMDLRSGIQQCKDEMHQLAEVLNAESIRNVEASLEDARGALSTANDRVARLETDMIDVEQRLGMAAIELKLQEETFENMKVVGALTAQQQQFATSSGFGTSNLVVGLGIPIVSSAVAAHFMKPETNISAMLASLCGHVREGLCRLVAAVRLAPFSAAAIAVGALMLYAGYKYYFCQSRAEVALKHISACRRELIMLESRRGERLRSLTSARQAKMDAEETIDTLTQQLSHLRSTQQQHCDLEVRAEALQHQLASREKFNAGRQQLERELAALAQQEAPLLSTLPLEAVDHRDSDENPIAAAVDLCKKAVDDARTECDRRLARVNTARDAVSAMDADLQRIELCSQHSELSAPNRAARAWRQNLAVA